MKRDSPEGGTTLLGQFIPEGTPVRVSNYTLSHDPRYFSPDPEAYRPERWLDPEREEALVKLASSPFLLGPFGCIGKQLALKELRITLASTVLSFDIAYAPGFDEQLFMDTMCVTFRR
jgi:cytochrome P450